MIINYICDYCETKFLRKKSNKSNKHYCNKSCAASSRNINSAKKLNIGDKKFKLTILDMFRNSSNNRLMLKCECECGNITNIVKSEFGVTKTCGKKIHYDGILHPSYKGCGYLSLTKWNQIKSNAYKRHINFNISVEYAWELFEKQRGECALTGVEINLNPTDEVTASLDRIDSTRGYEMKNVQWVHKIINRIKTDLNINLFKQLCDMVSHKSGNYPEKLDFNQVLLQPQPTTISSRNNVDLTTNKLSTIFEDTIPIIAANFDTVGSFEMAKTLSKHKVMTCLSKHYSDSELIDFINNNSMNRIFYSTGITQNDIQKLKTVLTNVNTVPNICVDVAHAENPDVCDVLNNIRNISPSSVLMVGNVATPDFFEEFKQVGVKIIKVGIGSGAVCTTRLVAGVGIPQFSAIVDCVPEANRLGLYVCSDGGCVHPADVCKAFAAGSSMVMLGSMLSGTDECNGEWIEDETGKYLVFYGMSSNTSMKKHGNGEVKNYRSSEGRTVKVKYKGSVEPIISNILGGLRSACTYQNAHNLIELYENAIFIKVQNTHNTAFEQFTIGN